MHNSSYYYYCQAEGDENVLYVLHHSREDDQVGVECVEDGPLYVSPLKTGTTQPSRGQHGFVLQLLLQLHQSSISKSWIKCCYYCVFQTCFDYLFKPEHWHHHLGDLPSFSEETKALPLTNETTLNVCGASLLREYFPYVIPATAFM